jgi:hypothetical protein
MNLNCDVIANVGLAGKLVVGRLGKPSDVGPWAIALDALPY